MKKILMAMMLMPLMALGAKTKSAYVVFDAAGGEGTVESRVLSLQKSGENSFTIPDNPFSRAGHVFCGWNLQSTCADPAERLYMPGEVIDLLDHLHFECQGTITLSAAWVQLPERVSLTIRKAQNAALDWDWIGFDSFGAFWANDLKFTSLGCGKYVCPLIIDDGRGSRELVRITTKWPEQTGYYLPWCGTSRDGYVFDGWKVYDSCTGGQDCYDYNGYGMGSYLGKFPASYFYGVCGNTALVATWRKSDFSEGPALSFSSANVLNAALYSGSTPIGVIQVKTGKISKKGLVKLTGYVLEVDGKKKAIKSISVNGTSGRISAALQVDKHGSAQIAINGKGLSGNWNGYEIRPANVGGEYHKTMYFDFGELPEEIYERDIGYWVTQELYSNGQEYYAYRGEPVVMNGKKWIFDKAAKVSWKKCKCIRVNGELQCPDCYGEWMLDVSRDRTNISALKLSYNSKTGLFKGSFKLYAEYDKGKKYTVTVSGLLIDGIGYGQAFLKKPAYGPWNISIR